MNTRASCCRWVMWGVAKGTGIGLGLGAFLDLCILIVAPTIMKEDLRSTGIMMAMITVLTTTSAAVHGGIFGYFDYKNARRQGFFQPVVVENPWFIAGQDPDPPTPPPRQLVAHD